MSRLIVECSEPGTVVSLCEDLENIFRNITFDRVLELRKSLEDLASRLVPEFEKAWQGFGIEVPNECGSYPPSFGKRDGDIDDTKDLKKLLDEAENRGLGKFQISSTFLLGQSVFLVMVKIGNSFKKQEIFQIKYSITGKSFSMSMVIHYCHQEL